MDAYGLTYRDKAPWICTAVADELDAEGFDFTADATVDEGERRLWERWLAEDRAALHALAPFDLYFDWLTCGTGIDRRLLA